MRKNHHGKKDRLVKRVFALCLALAVICTCLVPVFATEASSSLQVNQEVSRPVEDGEATYPDGDEAAYPEDEATYPEDEAAYPDGNEAAGFGDEPREVYDDSEAAGFGEEEASRPVEGEGGEDNPGEGGTVKDSEWGTVIEYGPSSETQWSDEDDVVEKPTDKEVVSGDQIKELQDMVVYRFWLKELNTLDLQDIATHAQNDKMTESEYLARNGEVLWGLYFIQAVPRAETIADYSSYIENPSSNRDPKGELRLFDYWYTLDDLGNRVRLDLSDPTSNILDSKTTTVNVYAAWKDGTVGSDEEEKVDHEDLVDKNPVPVDLTAKAAASYEGDDGELKTTTLPVEVKNLPSAAHSLSVIHMGDDDMESFYQSHSNDFGSMAPILGLKISPKNAKGETVQPAKGEKATVTVSGLDALPEMEGATASTLKVFHETSDGSVEKLDVLTYTNGTLTFETSSFSPFVVVRADGYSAATLEQEQSQEVGLSEIRTLYGTSSKNNYGVWNNSWSYERTGDGGDITLTNKNSTEIPIVGVSVGTVTVKHTYNYYYQGYFGWYTGTGTDTFNITITQNAKAAIYILKDPLGDADDNKQSVWVPDSSTLLATVDMTKLEGTWVSNKNCFDKTAQGNAILNWPENAPGGVSWTIKRGQSHFDDILGWIWTKEYRDEIGKSLSIAPDNLQKTDIDSLTVTVHKVSKDNGGDYPTHLDCKISVQSKTYFTAAFDRYDPNSGGWVYVDAATYETGKRIDNTTKQIPDTISATDGIVWEFVGWYPENTDTSVDGIYSSNEVKAWPYTPNDAELADGTVHFYAVYKPRTSNLTISKTVTGMLGDTSGKTLFNFKLYVMSDANVTAVTYTTSKDSIKRPIANLTHDATSDREGYSSYSFALSHGSSITFNNLPVGTYIVEEDDYSGNKYKTSYVLDDSNSVIDHRSAEVEMQGNARTLSFTNKRDLLPDTGVLLDTLPYIVILAVVAGGVALLMLRKRRKEDD